MNWDLLHVVLLTMLFSTTWLGHAQDASESATSTQKGSVQMEFATSNESYLEGEIKSNINTLFSGVVLYGIADALEFRAGLDFREEVILENGMVLANRLSGFSPLFIGMGYDLLPEKGILPQVTLIGDIFLPFTAGLDFRPPHMAESLRAVFTHAVGRKANLLYNLGVLFGVQEDRAIYIYTLAYYTNLTANFGFYSELFGDFHSGEASNHFCDLGLFYQVHPRIQLEAVVGTGIKTDQDIYFNGRATITIPGKKKNNINYIPWNR